MVHEADAGRADQYAVTPESPEHADDLVGHGRHHGIDGNNVERQPAPQEVHREYVVGEHRIDVVTDAEGCGEIERRFDDEQVGDRPKPQHEVGRIVVAAQSHDRIDQREHRPDDHRDFQHWQGPVLQPERIAELDETARGLARKAKS